MIRMSVSTVLVSLVLIGVACAVAVTPAVSATSTNATSTNATSTNATSTDATATNVSQQVVDQPHAKADLRGIQQFSPQTNASGEAYFRILDSENIGYVVDVRNISSVNNAAITYWPGGGPDTEVVTLRLGALEGLAGGEGRGEGTFGAGDISQRSPVEQSISDFVKHVLDGNIYLKIATVQSPLGEIAGKLVPQAN